jgi:hypothetical protein
MMRNVGTAGGEFDLVVGRTVEGHVDVGQFAHDGGQALDGQGDGARFLHLGLDLAADAQIEIGGGQRDLVLLRLDEHVAQDGHRGFGADHVEHLGEAVGEVIAVDFEFHRAEIGVGGFN